MVMLGFTTVSEYEAFKAVLMLAYEKANEEISKYGMSSIDQSTISELEELIRGLPAT